MRSPSARTCPAVVACALIAGAAIASAGLWPGLARADSPATAAPAPVSPESVAFKFNPPDEFTAIETMKSTTVRDMSILGQHTDERIETARWNFKKTPTGYDVTQTEVAVTMKQDGKDATTPAMTSTLNYPVTYEVDSTGKLVAIHGLDVLSQKIQSVVAPGFAKALAPLISKEALVKTATAQWNLMVVPFIDRSAKVGDTWTFDGPMALPEGGMASYHTTVKLADRIDRDGRKLVRVQSSFTADPEPLKEEIGALMGDQLAAVGATGVQLNISDAESSGTLDRVMDPETLFDESSDLMQTLKFTMEIPGQNPMPVAITTRRESSIKKGNAAPKPAAARKSAPEKGTK